ncbi:MAG TPA: glycosyltransferase family 39 protein [Vicinamibacteria bacterium]|nr:glycosyltransferase family 39 protein [Vicinamibacteria bacterium]
MGENLSARGTALLLATTGALLLLGLGRVPLLGPDEPRYARVAVEMQRAHEWVTPTLQGQPWLEKPALYYWLAGAAFTVLGENEAAARLPSVLAGLLLVGATALFGARAFGRAAGMHAGFILATALLPFAYGRAAAMDMLVAATLTAGVGLVGLRFLGQAGPLAVPAAALFLGLATLAKGPIGLLLPGLVVLAYLVACREGRSVRELLSPRTIAAFLVVAAPWYVAIGVAEGRAFWDVFLLNHNLQRFTSTVHNHPGPFFYYVPVLLAGLFPWSGLTLPAISGLAPRTSRADLFVVLWLAVPFAFFSLAGSKLPGYILPCLAPLAVLMGRAAARLVRGEPAPAWSGARAVAVVGLVLAAAVAALPAALLRLRDPAWTAAIPLALWAVAVAFLFARRVARDPAGALAILRVGGAGVLLMLTEIAPGVVSRHESGRSLFLPAAGRDVLALGAWRTAWMAGYFYNDGRVREAAGLAEVTAAAGAGPVLVLAGPGERRVIESSPVFRATPLAEGPRGNALLRVEVVGR